MTECKCKQELNIVVFSQEQLVQIDGIIEKYGAKPNYLIPVLKETQELFGYLPAQLQRHIAGGLNLNPSQVFGVITFYEFFNIIPRGKYLIRVCLGTACYVKGAPDIVTKITSELGIKPGETTQDRKFTFETVRCIGTCGLAPAMVVDNDVHGLVTPGKIMDILKGYE
ncbi:MAG: NAD(P)H-dependent oxidoreductase subunit E [Nitrospirota bacterium]